MAKKIITTVGTSILTNWDAHKHDSYEALEKETFFQKGNQFDTQDEDFGILKTHVWSLIQNKQAEDISAEIKSILKIVEETKEDVEVYLLATDTVLSVLACELVRDWFNNYKSENYNITVHFDHTDKFICKGLRVVGKGSSDEFQEKGFFSLIENIKYHKPDILCFSGGYKSIIPFMTLIGQIEKSPLYCIYEAPDSELVEIGNLPFSFDWEIAQNVLQYLETDNDGLILTDSADAIKFLTDNKFITSDKKPSAFSSLLKAYMDKAIASKTVLGRFIEYKYYEYFNEIDTFFHKPTKVNFEYFINTQTNEILNLSETISKYNLDSSTKYSDLKRKIKKVDSNLRTLEEIDLGLSLKSTDDTNVICEVKPIGELSKAIKQLAYGILAFHKLKGYYPSELLFATYIVKFQFEQVIDWENELRNKNIPNLLKQSLPANAPQIPFRIIASELNLTNSFKVKYSELFRDILDAKYLYNNPQTQQNAQ